MTSIPDLSQLDPEEQIKRNLIAKPDLSPGLNLPAIGPPSQMTQDVSQLNHLQSSPKFMGQQSGIASLQPKSALGKLGKGILGGLDTIGSIATPGLMLRIPGTSMHHKGLEAQAEGKVAGDVAEEQKQQQVNAETTNAETERERADEAKRHNQAQENLEATAPVAPPKPAHITYDNGIPVSVTDGQGNVFDVNDPKLPPALSPLVQAANRAHQQRISEQKTAEDTRLKNAQDSQNRVFAQQEKLEREREANRQTQAQAKQQSEGSQITPHAQTILQQTNPVKAQVEQLLQALAPYNNPDAGRLTMDRLKYALGEPSAPGELADQISKLELNRIISGARVLKGSSRAYQALERAMVHAPNPWVDKPQLMYQKLQTILQNLSDIEKDAVAYGKKGQTVQDVEQNMNAGGSAKPANNNDPLGIR